METSKQRLEYLYFKEDLNLSWEEELSMDYSNKFYNLKEIRELYNRYKCQNDLIGCLGIVAVTIVTKEIIEILNKME